MKWFILGIVGIPCGGMLITSIYHYIYTGRCIFDTEPIKKIYRRVIRWWHLHKKSKYLTELTQDPETGEIYYLGDGLRRNVGTSP